MRVDTSATANAVHAFDVVYDTWFGHAMSDTYVYVNVMEYIASC